MSADSATLTLLDEQDESKTLRVIGWFSVGMAVAAIGLYVGRELRLRYKFSHRTPSDFFAHAGDEGPAEYGVGI